LHPRARDTGLRNLPLHGAAQNQIWLEIVQIAFDLLAWTVGLDEIEAADFNLLPARHVAPVDAETEAGDDERRVRELTEELYGHFAEAARPEHEPRDVLGAL
jgi:hypothetical protein